MLLDSEPNAPQDFDFIIGDWNVRHRRLKDILNGGEEWIEFDGLSSTVHTLGGYGNIEDVQLNFPNASVRAKAIRSYNSATREWSIWWLDGRNPSALDTPVVGKFSDGIGCFYADERYNDTPIKVRFLWNSTNPIKPTWEQAFSKDNGKTWETNWLMEFTPKN
ncbi:DUF1579 domain-containing protein [Pseudoalteromonas sp. McH1-7]|uniref:DUF1579 domain-containing protein n=1 Tax=Pseudoalteromonas peptidolytica F12-50-A1 TaxID=1315280 RepID=A0A8I0N0F4_9GAMM|nr:MULTISPECIES: DUF1579 domain-containing protein [Pseudoalteromonas]MBE0349251.1 hypothetical protein [Pseudoalteromonas peptidolytica F12-50-A1]MDW7549056.1 DUF1579 domain-containing protein [Pseudoalteromonas peptidolytica]NLR16469.1 DUF1579 domain-containing protein [Pseudoalteromonas peptidolytica]NUZ12632.1 DUF1579 domain-containing protein [Pseudoalteromonas sp. McH1-7]RXE99026.1 DUF1579 domain-containing protein [Pseudoalteromonas sp. PS5]